MLRLYCLATRYCQTRSKHTLTLTRFISQQDVQKYADLTGKWYLLNYKDFFIYLLHGMTEFLKIAIYKNLHILED